MVLEPMLKKLAEGYLSIVLEQEGSRKEFFGLRDFYRFDTCFPYSMEVQIRIGTMCIIIFSFLSLSSSHYIFKVSSRCSIG